MKDTVEPCNRSELRVCKEMAIFVETYSSPAGDELRPNIVISKTIDVSANGLQVIMDKPAVPGSILRVCVEFGGEPKHYHLTGEVKWVGKVDSGKDFLVGFLLLESDHTDIEAWKQRVALIVEAPANSVY